MDLVAGARGRSLCVSELAGLSEDFSRTLQRLELQVRERIAFDYAPVGSLHPAASLVDELVDAIAAVDVGRLAEETDPLALLVGLGAAADAAMPWQPPHISDALAALPPVRAALRPVGAAIEAAPAAAWWSSPIALGEQYEVAGEPHAHLEALQPAGPALQAIRDGLIRYEALFADRPDDPAREPGGEWWSRPGVWIGPDGAVRPSSSRRLAEIGAVELAAQEDSFGPERAALRRLSPVGAGPRVFEVQEPSDWQAIVARYPFDVSRSRRGVWWQSTGIDGDWYIPDWRAVAHDYDAVHVSVRGYLTTAGEPLPVPGGSTVLAGWNPDVTYWLCDVAAGPTEHWHRTSERTTTHWVRDLP